MNVDYQKLLKYQISMTNDVTFNVKHLHSHCEIIHMLQGSAVVTIDGTEYELTDNKAIIIEPHRIHFSRSDWKNKIYVSFVSTTFIPSLADTMKEYTLENPVIALDESKARVCSEMLGYIIEKFRTYPEDLPKYRHYIDNKAAADTPFVKHLTESYVSLLLEDAVWKKKTASSIDNTRRIMEYCLSNYRQDISLGKISAELGITEATVTRVFNGIVKCPFRTYINNLRLSDAEAKLKETDMPITKISDVCGFETMRTFNRVFLAYYGVTPSQYRKNNKEQTIGI